jgi:hypothetical protein
MMHAFDGPLFDTYEIEVELQRRMGWLAYSLRDVTDEQLGSEAFEHDVSSIEICPIEVDFDDVQMEEEEAGPGKWTFLVPFRGDPELWGLREGLGLESILGRIDGLTLVLTYAGDTETEARGKYAADVATLQVALGRQKVRVEAFNEYLWSDEAIRQAVWFRDPAATVPVGWR